MHTDKKLLLSSTILGATGLTAGAMSPEFVVQVIGAFTSIISASAVAFQVVVSALVSRHTAMASINLTNAEAALKMSEIEIKKAEADKILSESDRIDAETNQINKNDKQY